MVKNHLKRIATPKTWSILRKKHMFVTRPNAGAHSLTHATSINTLFKELLGLADTRKEVKRILKEQEVLIDGKRRHDERFNVGFMDSITLQKTKQHFRVSFTDKGKLAAFDIPAKEAGLKIGRIIGKTTVKQGKIQVRLSDGRILLTEDKKYNVGDSLIIEVPSQKVTGHLPMQEGAYVMVYKGKYTGKQGIIESVKEGQVVVKTADMTFNTKRSYAYVLGDKKPSLKCSP